MTRDETIALSKIRPQLFGASEVICGKCGETATMVYTAEDRWVLMHEDSDTDQKHQFYPEV